MNKKILNALRYKDSSKLKKLIRQGYDISNIDLTTILDFKKDIVLLLIGKNKYINIKNEQNHTPLTLAIQKGEYEIVKKLLECGADVNYKAEISGLMGEMTPLSLALLHKDLKITTLLIKYGAEHKESYSGWNAFKKAVLKDDKEVYELLFDCQVVQGKLFDMSATSLFYAVENNNYLLLKRLIEDYEIVDLNYSYFSLGVPLLPKAVLKRSYEMVKLLIDNNIDINQSFRDGVNGLMLAFNYMLDDEVSPYDQEIVKLLIGAGIDIHKENYKGFTALMIASKDKKAQDAIDILINNGANLDHKNKDGLTALICAVKEKNDVMTKFLIEKGADPEISTKDGITPLMIACWQNDKEIISLLNNENIDIHPKDNEGFSAFDYLTHNNKIDVSLLDILGEKNAHQAMKYKISNIDTNHGINPEKYEQGIKEKTMRHKPKEVSAALKKFSSDENLRYSNHPWDNHLNYNDFRRNLQKGFEEVKNDLHILDSDGDLEDNLYRNIQTFLLDKNHIGWSSQIIKDEIEKGTLPHEISLANIEDIEFNTFGEAIDNFKSLFVVKQNDKKLKLLKKFIKIRKELNIKSIDLNDLKQGKIDKFFTDTRRFENALTLILQDIQENFSEDTKDIVVEADTISFNDEDMIEIKIIHINSTASKTAEALKKTIDKNGGNFHTIYKNLLSVCDWSIDTICKDGKRYRIDYLSPETDNNKVHCTQIDDESRGFTYILRFYI